MIPTTKHIQQIIREASALGAAQIAEGLGLSAGEISQRKARKLYGKWFTDAERDGRLHPTRIDEGRNGTRRYRVVAIQELRVADAAKAELLLLDKSYNNS